MPKSERLHESATPLCRKGESPMRHLPGEPRFAFGRANPALEKMSSVRQIRFVQGTKWPFHPGLLSSIEQVCYGRTVRFFPELFAFTDGDVWRPGIGDPTVMGWLTVAAYFGVAALCIRKAVTKVQGKRADAAFWTVLGCSLVALGINKQLDLQTFLTLTARQTAIDFGWYDHRRAFQFVFVVAIALAGAAGFFILWRLVKSSGRRLRVPLLGFMLLLCFVIVRAASFHHVDSLINFQAGRLRMNWALELGAIAVIAFGAWPRRTRESLVASGNVSQKVVLQ